MLKNLTRKKQYQVVIYEKPFKALKEYCSDNAMIMAGVVSRLVRQFIERMEKKKLERERGKKALDLALRLVKKKDGDGFNESETLEANLG